MFEPVKIAPSILSANFLTLGDDIRAITEAGADVVHVDVMDGHFVPNLTMGVPIIKQLKTISKLPLDVHLMISNPIEQLDWFTRAGCDSITVHAEPLDEAGMKEAVRIIHDAGIKAAVSVKPKTPVSVLEPVIADLEMVLIMSVEPGFSGQSYIADLVAAKGADILVCGSAVFGADNLEQAVEGIRGIAEEARKKALS